jgi:hypothetical protein
MGFTKFKLVDYILVYIIFYIYREAKTFLQFRMKQIVISFGDIFVEP